MPAPDKFRTPFAIINVVAGIATLLILYRSHIPGGSNYYGLGLLMWMLSAPAWIWILVSHKRSEKGNDAPQSRLLKRRLLIVPIMIGLSVLPVTQLPQFICFTLFRPYLDSEARMALQTHPQSKPERAPRKQAGPFPIYDVSVDQNGGVWIATTVRQDGVGADNLVDGFVLNPSGDRTPYGRKYYDKTGPLHMTDGWYTFQASSRY